MWRASFIGCSSCHRIQLQGRSYATSLALKYESHGKQIKKKKKKKSETKKKKVATNSVGDGSYAIDSKIKDFISLGKQVIPPGSNNFSKHRQVKKKKRPPEVHDATLKDVKKKKLNSVSERLVHPGDKNRAIDLKTWSAMLPHYADKLGDTSKKEILQIVTSKVMESETQTDIDGRPPKYMYSLQEMDLSNHMLMLMMRGQTEDMEECLYEYLRTRKKLPNGDAHTIDVAPFNYALQTLAKTRKLLQMETVLDLMLTEGIKPTLQSYAHFLECLGRMDSSEEKVEEIINKLQLEDLSVKDLYRSCFYITDEWIHVKKAVQKVNRDFEPRPLHDRRPYHNPLLQDLDKVRLNGQQSFLNPICGLVKEKKLKQNLMNRLKMEKKPTVQVKSVSDGVLKTKKHSNDAYDQLQKEWRQILMRIYRHSFVDPIKRKLIVKHQSILPYVEVFSAEEFSDIVCKKLEQVINSAVAVSPWTRKQLAIELGRTFMVQKQLLYKEKYGVVSKTLDVYREYAHILANHKHLNGTHREVWQDICNRRMYGATLGEPQNTWPAHIQQWIGGKIIAEAFRVLTVEIDPVKKNSKVKQQEPAFFETKERNIFGRCILTVQPHPHLMKLFQARKQNVFHLSFLPSTIPPVPWTTVQHGVSLLNSDGIIRFSRSCTRQRTLISSTKPSQILPVLDVLNYLGSCPWKVNKPILDLQMKIFSNDGDSKLSIPTPVSVLPRPKRKLERKISKEKWYELFLERHEYLKKSREMYSLWCSSQWLLSIANQFENEVLWLPLNLDFRGRVYPMSNIFSYQSHDVARSLFVFANGKPLGDEGLDWLKIHIVNLTGLKKKASNSERLAYANEVMGEILDSADNPLDGRRWWQESEYPWQTLACCKEVTAAVRSEDHTQYINHMPVHQDGSCNGLQHYAALGRDKVGATSVNLDASDKPNDVYGDIQDLVEQQRKHDADNGMEIAKILAPYISRKVVKRPVMTSVYGVTNFGAKLQVEQVLKEMPGFPLEHLSEASLYVSQTTLQCLQKSFHSAKAIQDWLTQVSIGTTGILKKHVEWVSPLGLPIVQPYEKMVKILNLESKRYEKAVYPDSMKNRNGFPPNYVHSLDSVHMMLTALHCMKANITFSSIHDCFWTHACDVGIMNKICREQFVALHSRPLLKELSQYMLETHRDDLKPEQHVSKKRSKDLERLTRLMEGREIIFGDFDLRNVLDSTYFFS